MSEVMGARPKHIQEETYEMPKQEGGFHPQIKIIQALSPERDDTSEKFIPGATEGQILLTGDKPTLVNPNPGVVVIPLAVKKRYAEYIPRKQGGGFVASYDSREEMEAGFTQGNDVSAVIDYLVMVVETQEVYVISFSSPTALGVATKWGNKIEEHGTMNGVMYTISSKTAKNKAGQPYKVMTITEAGWTNKELYKFTQEVLAQEEAKFLPAPEGDAPEI